MARFEWPASMLEECPVKGETILFFDTVWKESEEKSKKICELQEENEQLKAVIGKQDQYISSLEKQLALLQKTVDLIYDRSVEKNG